jgi:hypothetical protein
MSFRSFFPGTLLGAGMFLAGTANATPPMPALTPAPAAALQASASSGQAHYGLGAVVDVRQASTQGVTVLAITPGGSAEKMGLLVGDQLRAINGRRLDGTSKPSAELERALEESGGMLQVEAVRNGKPVQVSGAADTLSPPLPGAGRSCGFVTTRTGVVPRNDDIFNAEITQIDGRSTPIQTPNRHQVGTGKRVLVVRELIQQSRLNSAQLLQIAKMKKFAFARAYKTIVVDVQPDTSYRIGARLLRDKLDTQSIRDNAYWEPVVWQEVAERCP